MKGSSHIKRKAQKSQIAHEASRLWNSEKMEELCKSREDPRETEPQQIPHALEQSQMEYFME